MAKEYIEREAALRAVADVQYMMYEDEGHKAEYAAVDGVFHTLETVPIADVVEVVRCRDCKHGEVDDLDLPNTYYCHERCCWNQNDFYCKYGEKR